MRVSVRVMLRLTDLVLLESVFAFVIALERYSGTRIDNDAVLIRVVLLHDVGGLAERYLLRWERGICHADVTLALPPCIDKSGGDYHPEVTNFGLTTLK